MTRPFCQRCAGEVEDLGGYCRLGHSLAPARVSSTSAQLRQDVDDVFEDLFVGFDDLVDVAPVTSASAASFSAGSASSPPPPASPPKPRQSAPGSRRPAQPLPADDPISAFAPPPRMDWGPERAVWRRLLGRAPRRS